MTKRTENVANFIRSLITPEMSVDDVQKYQDMVSELETIDGEIENTKTELGKCKDKIVDLVQSQGNSKPPKDEMEQPPMTLEEIAKSVINGGK